MRHNQIRDLEASLLQEFCKDVKTEPKLIPLSGGSFRLKSTNTRQDARLDISDRGVWNTMEKTFYVVRVFHDGNTSNDGPIEQVFRKHEQEKKRVYNDRIIQVVKAPLRHLCSRQAEAWGKRLRLYKKDW